MQTSEYRVTMAHDGGNVDITVTASNASAAVDMVVSMERAPRRAARLVVTRPLQFERTDDTWTPVPGEEWGRVDDQPANVDVHTNPFAPDPENAFRVYSSEELETAAREGKGQEEMREELSRREDVARAVELWERLCEVPFVRGETQGHYAHSTVSLAPDQPLFGNVSRMPDREELEALILSDGEETAYPPHDAQPEYDPSIPDLTPEQRAAVYYHEDKNPWSGDDRLYPIILTLISCGDYHGSDVDAANNRALDGTPGVTVREPNTGGQGSVFSESTTVVGEMSSFENATDPGDIGREPAQRRADALGWLEHLVTTLEGLQDYGLLSEETHSKLIGELADEAWDSWLDSDTFGDLRDLAPNEDQRDRVDAYEDLAEHQAAVKSAYYSFEGNDWTVSSLGEGARNGAHGGAVKHVARTVFGWNVPVSCSVCGDQGFAEPGTVCGRDLSEESGTPVPPCRGIYR